MQKLITGLHDFQKDIVASQQEFFANLAHGQSPETMFITCSDSRVNPNLITQTHPGELFILRNAGNIIPAYTHIANAEAAAIEFAVAGLKVKDIIVCGHSHCGALKGVLDPDSLKDLPMMASWVHHCEVVRRIVNENYSHLEGERKLQAAIQENVLAQIGNLRTHPAVAVAVKNNRLRLHAWVYKIETGQVFAFNAHDSQFSEILQPVPA